VDNPRILVLKRSGIAEVVLLGPFLRNLRAHWPSAHLAVATDTAHTEALTLNPDVDRVLALPWHLGSWPSFLRELRRPPWTHVFDFDSTRRTALLTRLTGAPFRLALPVGSRDLVPLSETYLGALAPAGVPLSSRDMRLEPREADIADLRRMVGAAGPVLLVHPGSRSSDPVFEPRDFAAVCDRAQDELGVQVVLVGAPQDAPLIADIRGRASSHLLTLPQAPSLSRFAALARLSAVVLCRDGGPMHVAAAVGTPLVALGGPGYSDRMSPVGTGHVILRPPQEAYEVLAAVRAQLAQGALRT